jgi:hypothetical protein
MSRTLILFILLLSSYLGCAQQRNLSFSDFVGIGTINPPYKLSIQGAATSGGTPDPRTFVELNNIIQNNASLVSMRLQAGTSGTYTYLSQHASIYGTNYYGNEFADFGQLWSTGAGLILRAGGLIDNGGVIKFQTGNAIQGGTNERMRIGSNGNVGIGTQSPTTKLQVTNGDIYVENPNRGIILKSPSGNCYRVTIDDFGSFVRTAIACPN